MSTSSSLACTAAALQLGRQLLELLGLRTAGRFPEQLACPACGRPLLVEADPVGNGLWLTCAGGDLNGNIVECAAALWKTDPAAARGRLGLHFGPGAAAALDRLLDAALARAASAALLSRTPDHDFFGAAAGLAARALGCGIDLNDAGWDRRLGGAVYACTAKDLRQAGVTLPPAEKGRARDSHFLVWPAWERPGRPVAARLVGARDDLYATLPPAGTGTGGLLLASLLPEETPELGTGLVALLDDPDTAVRLQQLSQRVSGERLALGALRTADRFRTGWRWRDRPLTLWALALTPAALALARDLDAPLAVLPCQPDRLASVPPGLWVRRAAAAARPWHEHLRGLTADEVWYGPEALATYLQTLGLSAWDLRRLTGAWPERDRERALAALGPTLHVAQVGASAYERDGHTVRRDRDVVSHHALRLDRVVRCPDGRLLYRGRLLHPGGEVSFTAPLDVVEAGPDWARKALLRAGVHPGVLPARGRPWREAVEACLRLAEPQIVDGAAALGWQEPTGEFWFDPFVLSTRGECRAAEPAEWLGEGRPTRLAEPPGRLPLRGLHELFGADRWPDLLSLAAAVAARVLAPALRRPVAPLLLAGRTDRLPPERLDRAAALATRLGCGTLRPGQQPAPGWPMLCPLGPEQRQRRRDWLREPPPWLVTTADAGDALVLRGQAAWDALLLRRDSLPELPPDGSDADLALRALLPAYLAWLLGRRLRLPEVDRIPRRACPFTARVGRSLADWLGDRLGGVRVRPGTALQAGLADPGARACWQLTTLLRTLYRSGRLPVARAGDPGAKTALAVKRADGTTELYIGSLLARRAPGGLALDRATLRRLLLAEGVVTTTQARGPGRRTAELWTLSAAWWETNVESERPANTATGPGRRP